jgi:hypothetical protein
MTSCQAADSSPKLVPSEMPRAVPWKVVPSEDSEKLWQALRLLLPEVNPAWARSPLNEARVSETAGIPLELPWKSPSARAASFCLKLGTVQPTIELELPDDAGDVDHPAGKSPTLRS